MKALFKHTLLSLSLVVGAFTAQAQVKIGTSPTTIDPSNNLEVQGSTAGRKMTVDKTSGKVTIADGTEGNGKVLTSDAIGGASWQNAAGASIIDVADGPIVSINTSSNAYAGRSITFPKAGKYIVFSSVRFDGISTGRSDGHCFAGTTLSDSPTTYNVISAASQWMFGINGGVNSVPAFHVTVTAGQTLYFWLASGDFYGSLSMLNVYVVGPFL